MLQFVVVWCSVLRYIKCMMLWMRSRVLQCLAVSCSVVWCVAVCCSVLQCDAVCCSRSCVAVHCRVLR